MGDVGPVEGVAKKQCNMTIPYAVEGEKQSEVKIRVLGKSYQQTCFYSRPLKITGTNFTSQMKTKKDWA